MSFTQSASEEMRFRLGSQTRTEIRENKLCSRRGKQATKSLELGRGGGRDTKGPSPPLCTPIPSSLTMRNQQRGGKFDCAEESILFKHKFVRGDAQKGNSIWDSIWGDKGRQIPPRPRSRSSRVCSGPLVLPLPSQSASTLPHLHLSSTIEEKCTRQILLHYVNQNLNQTPKSYLAMCRIIERKPLSRGAAEKPCGRESIFELE